MRTIIFTLLLAACTTDPTAPTMPDAAAPALADYNKCIGFYHGAYTLGNANSSTVDFEVQAPMAGANPRIISHDTTVFGNAYIADNGSCVVELFQPTPSTTGAGCTDLRHGIAVGMDAGLAGSKVELTTLCKGNFSTIEFGSFDLTQR